MLEDEGNALLLVVIPFLFTLSVLPLNQLMCLITDAVRKHEAHTECCNL
jgi:hypothetical protein